MVIVQMLGGLGNQMFQYALYRAFLQKGEAAKLDISWIEKNKTEKENIIPIWDVFDLDMNLATEKEIQRLADSAMDPFTRVRRKLFGRRKTYISEKLADYGSFCKEITDLKSAYLTGYWQSYQYFSDVEEDIRHLYSFREIEDRANMEMIKRISETNNSVFVHVRLGDYLKLSDIYGGICTPDYYEKCMAMIRDKRGEDTTFFIFSNEPKKVGEVIDLSSYRHTIVDLNDEKNGWKDMQLMSKCQDSIIANSSFSWWAAYLNNNENKIVCAPKGWTNSYSAEDLIPEKWIRI